MVSFNYEVQSQKYGFAWLRYWTQSYHFDSTNNLISSTDPYFNAVKFAKMIPEFL